MARTLNIPFQTSTDFASCRWLAANGIFQAGSTLPNGITDRIWVEDGVCKMVLDTVNDEPDSSGWMRTEVDFGEFPTAKGEFWSVFEFQYDWTFNDYVVIGSWSVMINGASGTTYVPIGFRIRNHCLVIQSARDLNVIGFSNQDLAAAPIQPGRWHRVVAHANLQSDSTGFREVFLDDVAIVKQYGLQTTYPDASAHYFKGGIYDGDHDQRFPYASLSLRNVSMWSGNDGYQTVMGGVPMSPARLLQP